MKGKKPRQRRIWRDIGWPALAGVVSAVGLLGSRATMSALGVVLAFLTVVLVSALVIWSAISDLPVSRRRWLVQVPILIALALVVWVGLMYYLDEWSIVVGFLVVVTSPWLLNQLKRARERKAIDREFTEIARSLGEDIDAAAPDSFDD